MRVLSVLSVAGERVSGEAFVPNVPIVPALSGWLTDELDWPEPVPGVVLARVLVRLGRYCEQVHDEVISTGYRAQADALEIESMAKRRLADEYDAAQERGAGAGRRSGAKSSLTAGTALFPFRTVKTLASAARKSTRPA